MCDEMDWKAEAMRFRAERDQARQELARLKDRSRDTTVSAYDLLPEDEREAIAWVREHGGLSDVRLCHNAADNRRAELCSALDIDRETGWSDAMAAMRPRLMPEGMEFPRFDDGEPVKFGDAFRDHQGNTRSVLNVKMWQEGGFEIGTGQGSYDWYECGERVKRPAPKVLDADGVEIRVGDTVWPAFPDVDQRNLVERAEVVGIHAKYGRVDVQAVYATGLSFREQVDADQLTHRAPVLAADGRPLREGETVWDKDSGDRLIVGAIEDGGHTIMCQYADFDDSAIPTHGSWSPRNLTHERPESWERLVDDATMHPETYCVKRGIDIKDVNGTHLVLDEVTERMARDLVRRAKALAGVSE